MSTRVNWQDLARNCAGGFPRRGCVLLFCAVMKLRGRPQRPRQGVVMKSYVESKIFVLICALLIAIPSFSASRGGAGITIPAGTAVSVRMIDRINSDTNVPGQTF